MKAVVLAAGEGRRLRPLTGSMGKGMLPVGNRPILSYVLEALAEVNIRDIVMVVGYQKEKVMNRFGDGKDLGLNIQYVEQRFQLGTAHALLQAKERIDGRFLVVPGDSLVDSQALKNLLTTPNNEWGLLAAANSNSPKYGVVEVKGDKLVMIRERQKLTEDLISTGAPSFFALALWEYQDPSMSTLINTGTYLMDTAIFDSLEARGVGERLTLTSCVTEEAKKRKIRVKKADSWLDAVYPWDLLALNEHTLSRTSKEIKGTLEEGVVMKGPVMIGEGSRIRANSVLVGPISIGKDTVIGPSAYIGANVAIGDNCTVGPFSVVKDSIVMDDVTMGSHSAIHRSVIAHGSTLGDFFGVEKGEYTFKLERFTSTKVLGAIIGADCETSHHVSLSPGVILGNGCRVGPMRNIRDNTSDGTRVL
ncbi:MAG: NTP transferase domain-containing protein [Candidatus Thermoplasmatota archaeon]|nr:NTP transferase domain-containing protein [Candidatus Thermoplasmatota archaeon]